MASQLVTRVPTPVRGQGQTKCPDHQSEVVFYCKDCSGQLVCLECSTSIHQGHTLDKISDIASDKKQVIQDYVKKAEKTELPRIKQTLESVDNQTKENSKRVETLIEKIKAQGEKLKAEIYRNVKGTEQTNNDLSSKYRQEFETEIEEVCLKVDKCIDAIDSGNNITVIDVEREINTELKQPRVPTLQCSTTTNDGIYCRTPTKWCGHIVHSGRTRKESTTGSIRYRTTGSATI